MYELTIPAMTCGHCKNAITRAVLALDPAATLHFDLPAHKVQVSTSQAPAALEGAIGEAGYPVTDMQEAPAAETCCGHCAP